MTADAAIALDHVVASEGDQVGLQDFSLTVRVGEAVALVGSHVSGKGLLLRLCAGLEAPEAGSVRVLGVDPTVDSDAAAKLRRRVGCVFLKPALISSMNVFDNVALPLRYHGLLSEDAIEKRVMMRLMECGAEELRDRFPAGLTTGEARFVALARAMAMETELLIVDEVLVGWDAGELGRLRRILAGYRQQRTLTLVATFSVPTGLFMMMNRLVLLGNGRIIADCPPSEAARIDDPTLRDFITT